MKNARMVGPILSILFLILLVPLTKTKPDSWNDKSHLAVIESLVERGTWSIESSTWFDQTSDKVQYNGKFYSDKMPLLALLGAGAYALMFRAGNASLGPDCSETGKTCGYFWLTLILVGLPAALLVWLLFDFSLRFGLSPFLAVIGTLAVALGTMVFPYMLVLNHHLPAAVALFASFSLLTIHPRKDWLWLVAAGLLAGLAISFDIGSLLPASGLFFIVLARHRVGLLYFGIGALAPLISTMVLDYMMIGSVLPPYMVPGGYAYLGSHLASTPGGLHGPGNVPSYAFDMLVGFRGLFAFNPILLCGVWGLFHIALDRRSPLRIEAVCTAIGLFLLALFLIASTYDFGGKAYGERYFVCALPLLFAFFLLAPIPRSLVWKIPAAILFVLLLGLSVSSTIQGAQGPWHYYPPPLYLGLTGDFPPLTIISNLSFP